MKITEALIAEHVVFHSLFDHVERAAPRLKTLAEVKALANLLEALLVRHSRTEDELLIEPLEHCIEQVGQAESFHHEHEEIDASLGRIKNARSVAAGRQLLLDTVAGSRIHFDKEERILFPLAEKVLKSKTLNELGERWSKQREAV